MSSLLLITFRSWHRDEIFVCSRKSYYATTDPLHGEVALSADDSSAPPARLQLKLNVADEWVRDDKTAEQLATFLEALDATWPDIAAACDDAPRLKNNTSTLATLKSSGSQGEFVEIALEHLKTLESLVFFFRALLRKVSLFPAPVARERRAERGP